MNRWFSLKPSDKCRPPAGDHGRAHDVFVCHDQESCAMWHRIFDRAFDDNQHPKTLVRKEASANNVDRIRAAGGMNAGNKTND